MTNYFYGEEIYNPIIKQRFLTEINEVFPDRIFKASYDLENDLNKDLFDFNRDEIRKLCFLYSPSTKGSSSQNVKYIEKYIDWAIDEGLTMGVNPLLGTDREWREQFANENLKLFWRKDEIDNIILKQANAQDAVIISLLWNGIKGKQNSEITNLTQYDIDESNQILHIVDSDDKKRSVQVNEECVQLCLRALRESEYEKQNGSFIKSPIGELVTNKFVVKSMKTNTDHYDEAEMNIVYRRISNIARVIEEPMFNPRNIVNSGMLHLAYQFYVENGKLTKENIKSICRKFGLLKDGSSNGYEFPHNVFNFLNVTTIQKIYNV